MIELWNPTAVTADLSGWHLTDDLGIPNKWTFPTRILPSGGRLLPFASGKNRAPASGWLGAPTPGSANPQIFARLGIRLVAP